jgi:hypothetical protein
MSGSVAKPANIGSDPVLVQFNLQLDGRQVIVGPATRTVYNFETGEKKYVHAKDAAVFLTRSIRDVPQFISALGDSDVPPEETMPNVSETIKADFQEMPFAVPESPVVTPDISTMTAKQVEEVIKNATPDLIREWLSVEKAGKGRKGIILLLTKELANVT